MNSIHTHDTISLDKKFIISLLLNTGFTVFEFTMGVLVGSLALMSDAAHNLTHALILLISLFSHKFSQRKANDTHTYGFQRISILAAELNAFILIILASYIFYEAILRILHPEPVSGLPIILVAFIGIIVNTSIAALFRNHKHDLNIKSIFINLSLDALALSGTFIAGIIIFFTNLAIIDPIISIVISGMILYSSGGIIGTAIHLLMEGVPEGINPAIIKRTIETMPFVQNVDDFHVWAISSELAALSCHISLKNCELKESTKIVKQIKEILKNKFHIEHSTIETELKECNSF